MPIRKKDVPKTAFKICWRSYELLVMPFGVRNGPSQFVPLVQEILCEYLEDYVIISIDNILIFSRSTVEHVEHPRPIFQRLKEQQNLCQSIQMSDPCAKARVSRSMDYYKECCSCTS